MASYSRTMSHPPIFGALTRKINSYGAVAVLARKLAVTQPNDQAKLDKLNAKIDQLLKRGKYREPDYSPWQIDPEDLWGSPEGYNE